MRCRRLTRGCRCPVLQMHAAMAERIVDSHALATDLFCTAGWSESVCDQNGTLAETHKCFPLRDAKQLNKAEVQGKFSANLACAYRSIRGFHLQYHQLEVWKVRGTIVLPN